MTLKSQKLSKKNLSEGCSTLEIAMLLGCGHRTIKVLLQIRVEKKRSKLTAEDLRRIKGEASRNLLSSSAVILQNCNLA